MKQIPAELRELFKFREMLLVMVQRDIRIRYKNSFLGILWSFLQPMATVAVMTLVFNKLMHVGANSNYSAYLLSTLLPFTFVQQSMADGAQSVLQASQLVKKIYFPREILPLSIIFSNFIHLILGMIVFFGYLLLAYLRNPAVLPFQSTTIYLPLLLAISLCMATGLGLIVCAVNTFYEDIKYIIGIIMYLLFYGCPIIYDVEYVAYSSFNARTHGLLYILYNLNPIASLSSAYRKVLVAPPEFIVVQGHQIKPLPLNFMWLGYSAFASILILIVGYTMFNRLKWKFVERP